MEKTIWWKLIEFKNVVNMADRQKVSNVMRSFAKTQDEFQLCFDLFPIFCVKIDGVEMDDDAKSNYLKQMTDMNEFEQIQEELTAIIQEITDQKKKTNLNINSTDTTQLEK